MLISFELSMPSNNSWDGKWSGEDNLYVRVRNMRQKPDKGCYTYNFGDGWMAAVTVRPVDAKTAAKLRKSTKGFCGYDWMIDQIEQHGRILTLDEQKDAP